MVPLVLEKMFSGFCYEFPKYCLSKSVELEDLTKIILQLEPR